ncbi:MAG: hypothetical protein DRP84_09175 [Spirochaetes bacterium]|nr:MAG: hypothetical protein DRP84_09175 [Spirochaetota bacterium]
MGFFNKINGKYSSREIKKELKILKEIVNKKNNQLEEKDRKISILIMEKRALEIEIEKLRKSIKELLQDKKNTNFDISR